MCDSCAGASVTYSVSSRPSSVSRSNASVSAVGRPVSKGVDSTCVSSADWAIWSSSSPITFSASSVSPASPAFFMALLDRRNEASNSLSSSLLWRASSCFSTNTRHACTRWAFSETLLRSISNLRAVATSPSLRRYRASRASVSSWVLCSRSFAYRVALHDSRWSKASPNSPPLDIGSRRSLRSMNSPAIPSYRQFIRGTTSAPPRGRKYTCRVFFPHACARGRIKARPWVRPLWLTCEPTNHGHSPRARARCP